tara:strand:+ start:303 stop:539 length:237 start_codon:yes stop_codon:yes gene_type:complete
MEKTMEEKINTAFKNVLNIDPINQESSLIYNETDGWDSVGHMGLIAELENLFDCMMDMDDILDMSSYTKCIEIMKKYS